MSVGKFGLRIFYKDGRRGIEWFIEEKLRDTELKRYKRSYAVDHVRRINR